MAELLTDTTQLTPDWLTQAMLGTPALTQGRAEKVEILKTFTLPSPLGAVAAHIKYTPDASGQLPERVLIKIGRRFGEVSLHQHIAPYFKKEILAPCYYARSFPELNLTNLLFKDLSDTHHILPEGLPAPRQFITRFVDVLIPVHRQWWEHPDLKPNGELRALVENVPEMILKIAREQFPAFANMMGDRLSNRRRGWYERLLTALPHPIWQQRLADHQAVTLVHGDAHPWNFALPNHPSDPIYMLDWSLWHVDLPTYDLAYMLALRNYPERRQRYEKELLKQYFINLALPGYNWSQFWDDYRLSVMFHTLWPVYLHRVAPNLAWYQMFEQIMLAFEDLGCEELL